MLNTSRPVAVEPFRCIEATMPNAAIVGATGAVGRELLRCLEARSFPIGKLRLLASPRSAGQTLAFHGQAVTVEPLAEESFSGIDIALFSAGSGVAKRYAPAAVRAGAVGGCKKVCV